MTRVLLIPTLLLLAWPAGADDELETRLKQVEARVARLRADAIRELKARADIDRRIAELDRRIAAARKLDATALGATKIEELRAERAKLETTRRTGSRTLKRDSLAAAASVKALEDKRKPVNLEELLRKSRMGDTSARAELAKIRATIDQAIRAQPTQVTSQVIALGGRFIARGVQLQVINGGIIQGARAVPSQGSAQPKKPDAPKKKIPEAERKKRAAQDLDDQQERAGNLEKQIVDMTRKLMDLERRLRDLQEKVAKADRG